jgi:ubiquitin-protein ligase
MEDPVTNTTLPPQNSKSTVIDDLKIVASVVALIDLRNIFVIVNVVWLYAFVVDFTAFCFDYYDGFIAGAFRFLCLEDYPFLLAVSPFFFAKADYCNTAHIVILIVLTLLMATEMRFIIISFLNGCTGTIFSSRFREPLYYQVGIIVTIGLFTMGHFAKKHKNKKLRNVVEQNEIVDPLDRPFIWYRMMGLAARDEKLYQKLQKNDTAHGTRRAVRYGKIRKKLNHIRNGLNEHYQITMLENGIEYDADWLLGLGLWDKEEGMEQLAADSTPGLKLLLDCSFVSVIVQVILSLHSGREAPNEERSSVATQVRDKRIFRYEKIKNYRIKICQAHQKANEKKEFQKHSSMRKARVARDLANIAANPLARLEVAPSSSGNNEYIYFLMKGNDGTPFQGGTYCGMVFLPPNYPLKPPSCLLFLSPSSGRIFAASGRTVTAGIDLATLFYELEQEWNPMSGSLRDFFAKLEQNWNACELDSSIDKARAKVLAKWSLESCVELCPDFYDLFPAYGDNSGNVATVGNEWEVVAFPKLERRKQKKKKIPIEKPKKDL